MRAECPKFPQTRVFDTRFWFAAGESVADGRGGDSPWRRPRRLTRSVSTSTPEQVPDAASLPSIGLLSFDLRPDRASEGGTTWPTFQVQDTCSWIMALLSAPDRAAHGALQVCVAGGSRTLHHLINAVELIRSEEIAGRQAQQLGDRRVHVYLVPIARGNALAEFIARTDCW